MRRFLFLALILAADLASAQYSAYDGGLSRTAVQRGGDTLLGPLTGTAFHASSGFYGDGSGLYGVTAAAVPVYDDNTLLVTCFSGDQEIGLGTYTWSWIEQYWVLDSVPDPGWPIPGGIVFRNTEASNCWCSLYFTASTWLVYTNDGSADPWDCDWYVVPQNLATQTLVVSGLEGDEADLNGTYTWQTNGDFSGCYSLLDGLAVTSTVSLSGNGSTYWALVRRYPIEGGSTGTSLYYSVDAVTNGWWAADLWATNIGTGPGPTFTLGVTNVPCVTREVGSGYEYVRRDGTWPMYGNLDLGATNSATNVLSVLFADGSHAVKSTESTYTATVAKAGSALQAEVNYSADDVLPRVFLSPGADTNYLYVINGITTGTVAIVWPAGE